MTFLLQGNRHSLTVLSVEKGHLGVYACHAANAYGADSKKIEVSGRADNIFMHFMMTLPVSMTITMMITTVSMTTMTMTW